MSKLMTGDAKPTRWFELTLTEKQVEWIRLLCRFHVDLSENQNAIERTRKLMTCLEMSQFIREKQPK